MTPLGLVPAVVVWAEKATGVGARVKVITAAAFGLFLVIALRIPNLLIALSPRAMTIVYLTFAALCTGVCVDIVRPRRDG